MHPLNINMWVALRMGDVTLENFLCCCQCSTGTNCLHVEAVAFFACRKLTQNTSKCTSICSFLKTIHRTVWLRKQFPILPREGCRAGYMNPSESCLTYLSNVFCSFFKGRNCGYGREARAVKTQPQTCGYAHANAGKLGKTQEPWPKQVIFCYQHWPSSDSGWRWTKVERGSY